ncbi:MAG: SusD/RagB family nutrient-binding outer membrane lipoprotein [Chitinophagaceae bacterium]|nr:SusD/RagB family nutrient-binding outer membrane lipoprotein [Chitinophagaceae bacterium]
MKKFGLKIFGVSVFLTTLFLSSCKRYSSDFGDTNVNPGVTSSPLFNALLTNVLANLGGYGASTRGGLYCQYFSETQYTDVSLYSLPQLNFEGEYSGVLYDLQNIIDNGPNDNMKAVARILKSYIFSTITDRWGDVPYSQALKGKGNAAFDRQQDIYNGLFNELAAAVNQLTPTGGAITGDIMYGGNIAKWKKFANSLRLRLAIQITKRFPAPGGYAANQFLAALNHPDGIITDNADNFELKYPGGNYQQPWFSLYNGRRDYGESEPMTTLMTSLSDGRQQVFGGRSEDPSSPDFLVSSSLGVPYGRVRGFMENWTSANPGWARILRGDKRLANGSIVLLSAAETFLLRAEAADRGWTTENMNNLYQQGINASFAQWGLPAPPASYFTQSGVALANPQGTAANIRNIAIQQYIAAYPDGLRGWCIWRRTGFPTLTPAPDATNSSRQIPRRYVYGLQSYGTNSAATQEAASRLPGGDTQDSRFWWDQ